MNVKYINSLGAELNLNDGAYFVNDNDLRNFAWGYTVTNRPSGQGGTVKAFTRYAVEKSMNIAIRGTAEQFKERMNRLLSLTEPDIYSKSPGRLYLDAQYIVCYMSISSEIRKYSRKANFAEKALKILAVEPFWHLETKHIFTPGADAELPGGMKYNLRFPYRFGTGYSNQIVNNLHYVDTPAIITVYGPVENPVLYIAGNQYAVTITLAESERIEINQLARTIEKIDISGTRYNLFDQRDKVHDIFKPVPPGQVSVQYSGDWRFDVTLIQQRSEPLWT